jgi:hypothetical protein
MRAGDRLSGNFKPATRISPAGGTFTARMRDANHRSQRGLLCEFSQDFILHRFDLGLESTISGGFTANYNILKFN